MNRCLPRQFIRHFCLHCTNTGFVPAHLEFRLSVHPTLFNLTQVFTQCTTSSGHCTDTFFQGTVCSSDDVLFFLSLDPQSIYYLLIWACGIFASLEPTNVYKDMLNNMVSLIGHVVMNHQNQTRTISI
jgi:hypothetical protein